MNYKRFFLLVTFTIVFAYVKAQTYTQAFDSVFTYVGRNDATTGILYERVFPLGNLTQYNSQECLPDTSNQIHFFRAYYELCHATFNPTIPLISQDSLMKIVDSSPEKVQIGLLHFNINTFDTNVFSQKLYYDSDSILRENTSITASLYRINTLFVASPLTQIVNTRNVTYIVNNNIYFDNTSNQIMSLYIDFDDGLGYRSVQMNKKVNIVYPADGVKIIRFMAIMTDSVSYLAYAKIEINTLSRSAKSSTYPYTEDFVDNNAIESVITPPNPYEGGNFSTAKGNVRIYYANSDMKLRKPILIIDGFDPQNKRQFDTCYEYGKSSLWDMMFYTDRYNQRLNLCLQLLDMNYDVVMLDYPEGGTYIERNAMVCIEVLNRLNAMLSQNNSDEQIVVVGPSMGGQIARYALTYMEQNPNVYTNYGKHNARLWISYDSPHQGANIAMGAQYLMEFLADDLKITSISNIWNNTLCCPAAKQMLINHANQSAYSTHYWYYYSLSHLNNSNGYPTETRKIAVSNGSFNNVSNGVAEGVSFDGTLIAPLNLIVNLFNGNPLPYVFVSLQMKNAANAGSSTVVRIGAFIGRLLPIYIPLLNKSFPNNTGNSSPDVAPGGTYDTYDQVDRAIKNIPLVRLLTAVTTNQHIHCFMPITSTLDISNNMNYNTDISSRNLVDERLTPFDSYAGVMDSNMYHVTFNQHLVDYMLNEIETYIQGPREVQLCSRPTYTLHLPQDSVATVTWQSSDDIRLITGSNPYEVTIVPLSTVDGWVSAEVSTLKHRKQLARYPIHVFQDDFPLIDTVSNATDTLYVNTTMLLGDTFCVNCGKTVIVTDTLHCAPSARLIVRPGGKLVVDGGTLTSACTGVMWQGIYVEGHSNLHQTSANQGTVVLRNGALVENARCGIRTGAPGDTSNNSTGGIITAENSTFHNCAKAVDMRPYTDYNPATGLLKPNASSFTRCTFALDNDNLIDNYEAHFTSHARLWGVTGVSFTGCTFNNTSSVDFRGFGIHAEDAGFRVETHCSQEIMNSDCSCPGQYATHSTFSGFSTAVSVSTTGSPFAVTIDEVSFSNNQTGISVSGNNHATVTRCQFDLSLTPGLSYGTTGLELSACTGFLVEGNAFSRSTSSFPTYGVKAAGLGISNNSLYRNTFSGLTYGIYSSGNNGGSFSGLHFSCNTFSQNTHDIYVTSGQVAETQGNSAAGADNSFSSGATGNFEVLNPRFQLDYYYSSGGSHSPTAHTSNVLLHSNASANGCASTLCTGGGVIKGLTEYRALSNSIDGVSADNYDADGRADRIAVLQEMSDITSENIRGIEGGDTIDVEALKDWFSEISETWAKYSLAETEYLTDESNAQTLLGISAQLLTSEERDEYDNYMAFNALKEALSGHLNGHANWPLATEGQIAELQRIADANTGRSSVMARGVLCFFFGLCEEENMESNNKSCVYSQKDLGFPQWTYWDIALNEPVYYPLSFALYEDTVLQGLTFRKSDFTMTDVNFSNNRSIMLYEDSTGIYYWDDILQASRVLYDYTAAPGDSYTVFPLMGDTMYQMRVSVDSVRIEVIDNLPLHVFYVTTSSVSHQDPPLFWTFDINGDHHARIIEHIGATGFLLPMETAFHDQFFAGLCEYVDRNLIYKPNDTVDCQEPYVYVIPQRGAFHVKLYPNPATNTLNVEFEGTDDPQGTLTVTDITGVVVLTRECHEPVTQLDVSHLTPGLYVVSFRNAQGVVVRKFVKM